MLAPHSSPDAYAADVAKVLTASSLPQGALFFNAFGEGVKVSNYLSDPANVERIWAQTDQIISEATGHRTQ